MGECRFLADVFPEIAKGGRVRKDEWIVHTYYQPERGKPNTRTVSAYTGHVNTTWPGHMAVGVKAGSGWGARRDAQRFRIAHEKEAADD